MVGAALIRDGLLQLAASGAGGTARAPFLNEFPLTAENFTELCALIRRQAGIQLDETKREFVYSRLAPRLRLRNLKSFSEYLGLLRDGDQEEREAFTNALTTNRTSFFREPHHFPILARHVAQPHFVHAHRMVWSCACATGEEAYSIAMTLVEAFGTFATPIKVLATDIDTAALSRAEQGVYSVDKLAPLTQSQRERFFTFEALDGQKVARARPELRSLIVFRRANLLEARWPVRAPFDAVFARNVMIYFDQATKTETLRRLAYLMHPDSLLFVGRAETLLHGADWFTSAGRTVYGLTEQARQDAQARASTWRTK